MKSSSLFPRLLFCAECGSPLEPVGGWLSRLGKVRCTRCHENWSEVPGWL